MDPAAARRCDVLLGRSRTSRVADAALAGPGDVIPLSEPGDLRHLIAVAGAPARVEQI